MNIYFLVEGKRTEKKVYPKWLSFLIPELVEVKSFDLVEKNNYYIFSGNGFPSLLHNHLKNCVEDINSNKNYDYFIICLDSDELSIQDCKNEIISFMKQENIILNPNTKFEIIVQNVCFETWFLGNQKIFKRNPTDQELLNYTSFYNVGLDDPEQMNKLPSFENSKSMFHATYLEKLLTERNINYSKKNPQGVIEEYYLNSLIERNKETSHIQSFGDFISFCNNIKNRI
jgi:hypothetical protein